MLDFTLHRQHIVFVSVQKQIESNMKHTHKKHTKWWAATSLHCEKSTHGRYSSVENSNNHMDSDDQLEIDEMNPQAPTHRETNDPNPRKTHRKRPVQREHTEHIDLLRNRLCMTVCDQHRTLKKIFRGA